MLPVKWMITLCKSDSSQTSCERASFILQRYSFTLSDAIFYNAIHALLQHACSVPVVNQKFIELSLNYVPFISVNQFFALSLHII